MLGKSETLSLLLTNLERFRRPDVTIQNVLGVLM
jgi:hypothetical protein